MIQTLKLILPALIPSWRFFDVIAPSPRIEIAVMRGGGGAAESWREFRPRPQKLTLTQMLGRMIWNPRWNESLFLMSCAERLAKDDEDFARQEIFRRIKRELNGEGFIQFRLIFHAREDGQIIKHIAYLSPQEPFGREAAI